MKLSHKATLLALAATAVADVVRIPVARNAAGTARKRHPRLSKRATITESLVNNITQGGYYASVSVGTPGQDVTMVLDTGSSDAWVIATDADLCTERRLQVKYGETCGATCEIRLSLSLSCAESSKNNWHKVETRRIEFG